MGKKTAGVGVGLAALGAAAAFFLYGKNGKRNREKVRGFALKAKGEVLSRLENLNSINQPKYNKIVDQVTKKYKRLKKVSGPELKKLKKDLKSAWKKIKKELG